jgi:hypothetical protein
MIHALLRTPLAPSSSCHEKKNEIDAYCLEPNATRNCYRVEQSVKSIRERNKWIHRTSSSSSDQQQQHQHHEQTNTKTCKTLRFSGFGEGLRGPNCAMRRDYAVALESARTMASTTLQPVLLLTRYGLPSTEEVTKLHRYVLERGAIVILIHELSLQQHTSHVWYKDAPIDFQSCPFVRLDLSKIVQQFRFVLHDLLVVQTRQLCDTRYVLYTDNDIVFPSRR